MSIPREPDALAAWARSQSDPEAIEIAYSWLLQLQSTALLADDEGSDIDARDYNQLLDILIEHAGALSWDLLDDLEGMHFEPVLIRNRTLTDEAVRPYLEDACHRFLEGPDVTSPPGRRDRWLTTLDTLAAWDEARGPLPTPIRKRALRDVVRDGQIHSTPRGGGAASHPYFLWAHLVSSLRHLTDTELWGLLQDVREDPDSLNVVLSHLEPPPGLALRLLDEVALSDKGLAILCSHDAVRRDPGVRQRLWGMDRPFIHREYLFDDVWVEGALRRREDTPRRLLLELVASDPSMAAEVLSRAPADLLAQLRPDDVLPTLTVRDPTLRRDAILRLPDLEVDLAPTPESRDPTP